MVYFTCLQEVEMWKCRGISEIMIFYLIRGESFYPIVSSARAKNALLISDKIVDFIDS